MLLNVLLTLLLLAVVALIRSYHSLIVETHFKYDTQQLPHNRFEFVMHRQSFH